MEVVDRAVARVLRQKLELGLLDPGWSRVPDDRPPDGARIDLDPPAQRALARRLAEESVILLANDGGALPLARRGRRPAGSRSSARSPTTRSRSSAATPCPGTWAADRTDGAGVEVATLLDALREELPDVVHARGTVTAACA